MTLIEWRKLEAAVLAMTDEEKQRLAGMLGQPATPRSSTANPSLGLFADEPELIDEVMAVVYRSREHDPLRTGD